MTKHQALQIAEHFCLDAEVQYCLDNGFTPEEALWEWDLPTDLPNYVEEAIILQIE